MLPFSAVQRTPIWLCASLLAACGGGSGTAPNIAVEVTAPSAQAPVLELQTPLPVGATVELDAMPAPDATLVHFSSSAGLLSPATASTHQGQASSSLLGTVPGQHTLRAEVEVAGVRATSSTQTFYLRQTPVPLEVLVPAYFYPSTGSDWTLLASSVAALPGLKVTAILNPSNGIFTNANSRYLAAGRDFVHAGGQLLGYVHTSYGSGERTLADIKTNIDRYLELYGRELISGIFLDEMSNKGSTLEFYQQLYRYIKAKDPSLRVVGNPGTIPASELAATADALITFEGQAANFAQYDPRKTGGWLYTLSNSKQGALIHTASTCTAMQAALRTAAPAQSNSGLVYVTHRPYDYASNTGNPWASLPSYWASLLSSVHALNQGQPLPNC